MGCSEGRSRLGGRIPELETRFCLLRAHYPLNLNFIICLLGIMTSHLLLHTVVKKSIKLIYVKVFSKLDNAMQMWVIIVVFPARYLLFHFLLGYMSSDKLLQGKKRKTQGTGLALSRAVTKVAWHRTWSSSWLGVSLTLDLMRKRGDLAALMGMGS